MILFLASRPIVPRPSHTTPPLPRRRPPRVQSIVRALLIAPALRAGARARRATPAPRPHGFGSARR
ncbi:hypothetical protein [Streptomyces malaysiensis]|uniref:hypothetical protein n=1 Tax=Streptomyces malaysiensis TaxID=92644 RepID=UPI002B2A54E1|nr:hypothetical protein R8789_28730 [Streptomyces malaysiensis]